MGELQLVVARRAHIVLMSADLASGVTFASFAARANCAMPASYNLEGGGASAGGVGGDAGAAGNAGVAGDEGVPPSSNGACDCSVGVGSRAKELVIAANALLVLMGLALDRRRQSRRP
jgi:hypothetical protein